MADELDLAPDERAALAAVTTIEAEGGTASIRTVAERAGLEPHRAEDVLGHLASDRDLLRETRTEQDPDAVGVGRQYETKARPAPG